MPKNLLILGAAGFIGENLVRFYKDKPEYKLRAIWHETYPSEVFNGIEYIQADLTHKPEIKRILKDQQVVIQAAAVTTGAKDVIEKPYIHVTDNAVMNSLLLREAHEIETVKHFVFFSCTVMYQPKDMAQRETDWNAGEELFPAYYGVGNTKVYIEKMLKFYASLGRFKTTAIRHSNVYGPFDKFDLERSHVVGATVTKVLNSEGFIDVWGTGRAKRDLIYIDDLMQFVDRVITRQSTPFELVNCGAGHALSIADIVNKISKAAGKNVDLVFQADKPDIPTTVIVDCSKAKREFGWEPQTSFEEGIAKTIKWMKTNA